MAKEKWESHNVLIVQLGTVPNYTISQHKCSSIEL